MITRFFWEKKWTINYIDYLIIVIGTILTFALDILLLPFEILAFLLHRLVEGEWLEQEYEEED